MQGLNDIGKMIFDIILGASYWIVAIIALKSLLSSIAKHDVEGIIKVLIQTAISYASLFLVTKVLDMVKGVMQ
jgi:hypothetical protein